MGFFFIPHFYLFIYYYFLTQVDKLGGTEPLSSETEGCLCVIDGSHNKIYFSIAFVIENYVELGTMEDAACGANFAVNDLILCLCVFTQVSSGSTTPLSSSSLM